MHAKNRTAVRYMFKHYDSRREIRLMRDGNLYEMMQETIFSEPDEEEKFDTMLNVFPWQCVSFMRTNGTSLDLIIKDQTDIMVLLNVV